MESLGKESAGRRQGREVVWGEEREGERNEKTGKGRGVGRTQEGVRGGDNMGKGSGEEKIQGLGVGWGAGGERVASAAKALKNKIL